MTNPTLKALRTLLTSVTDDHVITTLSMYTKMYMVYVDLRLKRDRLALLPLNPMEYRKSLNLWYQTIDDCLSL